MKAAQTLAVPVYLLVASIAHAQSCSIPGDTLFASGFEELSGSVYYVATSGHDADAGSFALPWGTIQHAADTLNAGDVACVHGGVYNALVSVTRSGSSIGGSITLRNYPGETPILDGTGLTIPNDQWGLLTIDSANYVNVRGFELRNYATTSSSKVPIGLYVTGAGTEIRIGGNHIHDIKNTASGCAANAFGLKVDGTQAPASINQLTISGNEIDHLVLGCSESFSLDGNVEFWTIADNLVHDTNNIAIGAIGYEGVAPNPAYDRARDGTIVGNTIYNITSFGNPAYGNEYAADGIYIDGGTRITIERNLIHHVDLGIELASEHSGRVTDYVIARNNLVYLGNSAGISLGGYAAGVGGSDHCTVVNNTLFHNDTKNTGSGELQIQYHAGNNLFANNLVVASAQGLLFNAFTGDTTLPAQLDYNLYFASASPTWIWRGTDYSSLANFRTGSSQDAHALYVDPQLLSTATPDLRVAPTSLAVGAGNNLGAAVVGDSDFAGKARVQTAIDIGAYEQ